MFEVIIFIGQSKSYIKLYLNGRSNKKLVVGFLSYKVLCTKLYLFLRHIFFRNILKYLWQKNIQLYICNKEF